MAVSHPLLFALRNRKAQPSGCEEKLNERQVRQRRERRISREDRGPQNLATPLGNDERGCTQERVTEWEVTKVPPPAVFVCAQTVLHIRTLAYPSTN